MRLPPLLVVLALGCGEPTLLELSDDATAVDEQPLFSAASVRADCASVQDELCQRLGLLAERTGEGAAVTGGALGRLYRVTVGTDARPPVEGSLRWAMEQADPGPLWVVFDVAAVHLDEPLKLRSDVTLDGRGRRPVLFGPVQLVGPASNVIVSDVSFGAWTNPTGNAYSLLVTSARTTTRCETSAECGGGFCVPSGSSSVCTKPPPTGVWLNHLHFRGGLKGVLDDDDASTPLPAPSPLRACLVYVVGGARGVTVSHSRFEHQDKALELGNKSWPAAVERTSRITVVGNVFDRTCNRHPRVNQGAAVHAYSNLITNYACDSGSFGMISADGSKLLAEYNLFDGRLGASAGAAGTCLSGGQSWAIRSGDAVATAGGCGVSRPGHVWWGSTTLQGGAVAQPAAQQRPSWGFPVPAQRVGPSRLRELLLGTGPWGAGPRATP